MIKQIIVFSAVTSVLLFSGCSTKEPSIDPIRPNTALNSGNTQSTSFTPDSVGNSIQPTVQGSSSNTSSTVIPPITDINSKDFRRELPNANTTPNSINTPSSTSLKSEVKGDSIGYSNNIVNASDGSMVSIFFDYDKFDIRDDMQEAMSKNSALIKGKTIKIEGNCDEFGSDEYNVALGLKRANSVKTELVNAGINPELIGLMSLGESNPVCLDKTQECWAKNRRVDFKLP